MQASVAVLRYWKGENDVESCEDSAAFDLGRGLFAIADGVGTASFSDIWAKVLVQHFISVPLLSTDPFEVEWWLGLAQQAFRASAPDPESLDAAFVEKARKGSGSTIAALRFDWAGESTAWAHLLAVGDSCAFVLRSAAEDTWSFPLTSHEEFRQHPVTLPTKDFDRRFHLVRDQRVKLCNGDVVVLATDAVAEWILGSGSGRRNGRATALRNLIDCSSESWAAFIESLRGQGSIRDDDSTAIVVHLVADRPALEEEGTGCLGSTTGLGQSVISDRQRQLDSAICSGDSIRMAVLVGDRSTSGVRAPGVDVVAAARAVADAFVDVLAATRTNLENPPAIAPVWARHAPVLRDEPGTVNLIKSLTELGVISEPVRIDGAVCGIILERLQAPQQGRSDQDNARQCHQLSKRLGWEAVLRFRRLVRALRRWIKDRHG
jgi:hypothetical protein